MAYVTETNDAVASTQTPYAISVGDYFVGYLTLNDQDWIEITLTAGTTYTAAMAGLGTQSTAVSDPYLELYSASGTSIATNDDGGPGLSSNLTYTPTTSGTYYIAAGSYAGGSSGDYAVSLTTGSKADYDLDMGASTLLRTDTSWSSSPATGTTVTWGFRNSGTALDADGASAPFAQLTSAQMATATEIVNYTSSLTNLTLTQVAEGSTTNSATILFGGYTSSTDGAGAYAYFPGSTAASNSAGDLWVNNRWVSTSALPVGGYSYFVFLHEFGHAIGLSHPGDYNAAAGTSITYASNAQFISDSHQYSVMSYFDEANTMQNMGLYPQTYMLYDIYALQMLYGVNTATNGGDSVYGFNSNVGGVFDFSTNTTPLLSIWDGNGTDTIDLSGFTTGQLLDLNDGTFSNIGGYDGNVSIAYGAVIENGIGGTAADTINGNEYANTIRGLSGDDTIDGGAGDDHLFGNLNHDVIRAGSGADDVRAGWGNDTVYGGDGDDLLYGYIGHDRIYGEAGNDSIFGDRGRDILNGGEGDDYIHGGADNDFIAGEEGNDILIGGDGNDQLYGFTGDDSLHGWAGNDLLRGGDGNDFLAGNEGNDTLYGMDGNDRLYGATGNDTLSGGAGDDILRGGTGTDTFIYDAGADRIGDFLNDVDRLSLDSTALGLIGQTAQDIAAMATQLENALFWDFGGGNTLTLNDWEDPDDIVDDIYLF
jgi:serralysin